MNEPLRNQLSQRERQIMDIVFQLGEATAIQIQERMTDPPSNSALRTLLRILEEKGHLTHHKEGRSFVYRPTAEIDRVRQSTLAHLVKTIFRGSGPKVVATLLSINDFSEDELDELSQLIEDAKKEEK